MGAYSTDLPGLRWKRSPAVAAACIMAVRSFAVHVGFFAHVRLAQGLEFAWTPALGFAVAFMLLFSIVIAFSKDIPDVEGDRIIGIRTLSVRVGTRSVFKTCIAILLTAYAGAVAFGAASSTPLSRFFGVLAHAVMGILSCVGPGRLTLQASTRCIHSTCSFGSSSTQNTRCCRSCASPAREPLALITLPYRRHHGHAYHSIHRSTFLSLFVARVSQIRTHDHFSPLEAFGGRPRSYGRRQRRIRARHIRLCR